MMDKLNDYKIGLLRNLVDNRGVLEEKIRHLRNRVSEMESEMRNLLERLDINSREIRELIFGDERE